MPADKTGDAVRFDHVGLTYAGAGAPSLTDISFTAKKGQTIGVIGGTGSGKSSLVNLIPRFYDATEGSVEIFGRPVASYPQDALRGRVAVVMQKAQLFGGTIRSNLLWGNKDATDADLWAALEAGTGRRLCACKAPWAGRAGGAGRTQPFRRTEAAAHHRPCAGGQAGHFDFG